MQRIRKRRIPSVRDWAIGRLFGELAAGLMVRYGVRPRDARFAIAVAARYGLNAIGDESPEIRNVLDAIAMPPLMLAAFEQAAGVDRLIPIGSCRECRRIGRRCRKCRFR